MAGEVIFNSEGLTWTKLESIGMQMILVNPRSAVLILCSGRVV